MQTVGAVARQMVGLWLSPAVLAGNEAYKTEEFNKYWAARKDSAFCSSWFEVKSIRATGGMTPFQKERTPRLLALRQETDKLPKFDRDWVLLWLAASRNAPRDDTMTSVPIFITTEEVIAAGKRLGPARLMDLLLRKKISDDPDLAPNEQSWDGRNSMCYLVLRHAGALFRPQDAETILALEMGSPYADPSGHSSLCVVAAASLKPEKAQKWLRDAMPRYNARYEGGDRAYIARQLWITCGPSEMDYLLNWFWGEKTTNYAMQSVRNQFLQGVIGQHAPADRTLFAKIAEDARFYGLDLDTKRIITEALATGRKL